MECAEDAVHLIGRERSTTKHSGFRMSQQLGHLGHELAEQSVRFWCIDHRDQRPSHEGVDGFLRGF